METLDILRREHPTLGDVRHGPDGRSYADCARCGITISASDSEIAQRKYRIHKLNGKVQAIIDF